MLHVFPSRRLLSVTPHGKPSQRRRRRRERDSRLCAEELGEGCGEDEGREGEGGGRREWAAAYVKQVEGGGFFTRREGEIEGVEKISKAFWKSWSVKTRMDEGIHERVGQFIDLLGRSQLVAVGVFRAKIDNVD